MNQGKPAFVAARLGQHRHIGRQGAAQRGARGLIVGERRREMIGQPARPLEHLALVVRTVGHLKSGRDRRRLRLGEAGAAGIGEVAERQKLQAVTGGADLAIDLEAALKLLRIVEPNGPETTSAAAAATSCSCASAARTAAPRAKPRARGEDDAAMKRS